MDRIPIVLGAFALLQAIHRNQAPQCPLVTPLRVGPDSIAYIPTQAPFRDVLRLCPSAQKTWRSGLHVVPALALYFTNLSVMAWQNRDELDLHAGADMWVLRGTGALLPGGISTSAPWQQLRSAYGPFAIIRDGDTYQILPCRLRGVVFFIGDPENLGEGVPVTASAESIPDTTHLSEIWITAGANRPHYLAQAC